MSEKALETLQKYGINPSLQRIAIMDFLLCNFTHPTVDEVYVALAKNMPTLSKTTVYNTLHLFAEQGAVQMLTIDEKKVCYDGVVKPHAHFMCKKCGRLMDVALPCGSKVLLPSSDEFEIDESHLYYKGTCKACSAKADGA